MSGRQGLIVRCADYLLLLSSIRSILGNQVITAERKVEAIASLIEATGIEPIPGAVVRYMEAQSDVEE